MKDTTELIKKTTIFLFILLWSGLLSWSQDRNPMDLQDFEGFDNLQYAAYLEQDGWPVQKLNTAVHADYLQEDEKNLVLAMNLIRYDPAKYARLYVYPRLQYFQGNLFHFPGRIPLRTREGIEAVRELYLELKEAEPLPLFYPSRGMSRASADHARYMQNTGTTSHAGQGGLSARVNRHGQWVGGLAENLAWGNPSAHDAIISLMIDDNVKSRGHRINIMNPEYNLVGVAIEEHPRHRVSYVINYAIDYIGSA